MPSKLSHGALDAYRVWPGAACTVHLLIVLCTILHSTSFHCAIGSFYTNDCSSYMLRSIFQWANSVIPSFPVFSPMSIYPPQSTIAVNILSEYWRSATVIERERAGQVLHCDCVFVQKLSEQNIQLWISTSKYHSRHEGGRSIHWVGEEMASAKRPCRLAGQKSVGELEDPGHRPRYCSLWRVCYRCNWVDVIIRT